MSCEPERNARILAALKKANEEGNLGFNMYLGLKDGPYWMRIITQEEISGELHALYIKWLRATAALLSRDDLLYCRENLGEEAWKKLAIEIPPEPKSEFPYAAARIIPSHLQDPFKQGHVLQIVARGLNEDHVKDSSGQAHYESYIYPITNPEDLPRIAAEVAPAEFRALAMPVVEEYKAKLIWLIDSDHSSLGWVNHDDINRVFDEMSADSKEKGGI
ncbi:hypothetical protein C4565_03755 [Candidatus Parcubacteria bacterium]|nr:MAG: hypothetical protein C4565_03755 [Candidatus Parcubacteria bacterium]